ncbi:MAG: sensor histidine kinase, partial [Chloroflexota bacterium]
LETHLLTLAPAETELAPIIRAQVQKARHRYPNRPIRVSITDSLPLIVVDARRVGQIIATLLSNAALFSPGLSPIVLSVRREDASIVIAVADHGIGLDETDRTRLFQKFYRAERAHETLREGLGLSLFVAAELAGRLGGRLWAASPGPGQGATFSLELPCPPAPNDGGGS